MRCNTGNTSVPYENRTTSLYRNTFCIGAIDNFIGTVVIDVPMYYTNVIVSIKECVSDILIDNVSSLIISGIYTL